MVADPTARPVLAVTRVTKAYGPRTVVAGVTFNVGPGERVALTGPSGSGKTTLLNCLGGVDRPDEGEIRLLGERIDRLSSRELAQVRRRKVGTIFQFFHLLPTLTASENVEMPLLLLGVGTRERATRVAEALERVKLSSRASALPSQLSGGEQQRVAIARALVHRPALVLADEPTGNLDSANGRNILDLLEQLTDELRIALVLVTHSEDAAAVCHRRIMLKDGQVVNPA